MSAGVMEEDGLKCPPDAVWPLLTDVHCHPTDDPKPWGDIEALVSKLADVKVGRVFAMSTSNRDQELVSQLADRLPGKIVPAFGYHPWFVHLISTSNYNDPKEHFRQLFQDAKEQDELEKLLPELPDPVPLTDIMSTLRANLQKYPEAILGEVGIDRAFRIPRNPRGWTREPEGEEQEKEEKGNTHTLALRERPLTLLNTPMDHQLTVIKEQIALAIELGRSVSLHSVRADGATVALLDDLRKAFPSPQDGMNKKERKMFLKNEKRSANEHNDDEPRARCFQDINIDLHSCTLSAPTISQLQQKHPNLYVSFSTAINSRQKGLREQLKACDPKRLLIESDYHSAQGISSRCWEMLRLAADVLGQSLIGKEVSQEDRYLHAANVFEENTSRFMGK